LGDRNTLRIDLNLSASPQAVALPPAESRLFDSSDTRHPDTSLAAYSCVVSLLPPGQERP
jgi:maltooligosyltrehalose trehalohydrolase